MTGGIRSVASWPMRWGYAALFAALALRVLIPAGWMPVAGTDGAITITLCSGTGVVELKGDEGGHEHHQPTDHDKSGHNTDKPCTGAGMALPLVGGVDAPALSMPVMQAILPLFSGFAVSVGRGLAAPPPPATGPPTDL